MVSKSEDPIDEYAAPQEQKNELQEIFLEIEGDRIEVFSDLDPLVIMSLNNVIAFAHEMESFRIIRNGNVQGKDPALTVAKWVQKYLRLRASKSRKSRGEVEAIYTAKEQRTRENIRIDGNGQGNTLR